MSLPDAAELDEQPPRRPSRGWTVVGVVGELLVTVGVLLLLFVVYQLWWTNVVADQAASRASDELAREWENEPAPPADGEDDEPTIEAIPGNAFALMYIPRLSDSVWGTPVLEGVQPAQLAQGIGHYPETAMPGEVGNFAVAGHRATNGEPLKDIDQVREGDEVIVQTQTRWYVYTLNRDQIVAPNATWTIEPVPGRPDQEPTEELITLTTCNPRWASTQRWIWWGTLTQEIDKATGELPEAIEEGP